MDIFAVAVLVFLVTDPFGNTASRPKIWARIMP